MTRSKGYRAFVVIALAHLFIAGLCLPASAKITACGSGTCSGVCVEYETKTMHQGETQTIGITGGIAPFKLLWSQNPDKVRIEAYGDRGFRVTALKSTTGFGVGPAQFGFQDSSNAKCGTGNVVLSISNVQAPQTGAGQPQAKPPSSETPTQPLAKPPQPGTSGQPSDIPPPGRPGPGTLVAHYDVFERPALDTSRWETMAAIGKTTGFGQGNGQNTYVAQGTLILTQAVTDSGGAVVTRSIALQPGKVLRITKKTYLHRANDKIYAATAILGEDASRQSFAQVTYTADAFFAGPAGLSPAKVSPIWDRWFDEVITYDPSSGKTGLSVNGTAPVFYQGQPSSTPLRVGVHAYGWYTGHHQRVRSIIIEWVDGTVGAPAGMTPVGSAIGSPLGGMTPGGGVGPMVPSGGMIPSGTGLGGMVPAQADVNGLWVEQGGGWTNTSVFYQEGSTVKACSGYELRGRRYVWCGEGTILGSTVQIRYHVTKHSIPPEGREDGAMTLTVSPDGNSMSGTAHNNAGTWSGRIVLKRVSKTAD
jgi:hypothetical protein